VVRGIVEKCVPGYEEVDRVLDAFSFLSFTGLSFGVCGVVLWALLWHFFCPVWMFCSYVSNDKYVWYAYLCVSYLQPVRAYSQGPIYLQHNSEPVFSFSIGKI
jgi:hypothetical protein